MNGLNVTMADQKELAHDSPEPQENRINEHKEKDVEAQSTETVEELSNHKHRDANSLQNEDTCLDKNINSINNEDHKPNENVNCNTNINETSLEHSQSTLNLKTNENSTGDLENDKSEKIPSQSNPEPNLEQNVLSIDETCKKDLILQNGNPVLSKNGVSGGETEMESEHNEASEASAGRRAKKTASVHLENDQDKEVDGHDGDKSSQNSPQKMETSDAPLLKNNKTDSHNGKPAKPPAAETPVPLRRSRRAIKRKRYDNKIQNGDDTSDDCYVNDSHRRKYRAIVVNDTKTLVEMAAKQMKSGVQKKEPTVVIIDTNSMNSMTTQQSILPSLTDDMFVVEAPSFIVPYVYEKPSKENFRKYVDNLANELKKEIAKVERQREKAKKESEKEGDSKEERVDKKDADESEDKEVVDKLKDEQTEDSKSLTKEKKKEPRRQRNDDDDMSWDGESSSSSDDDIASDEEDKTILRKAKTGATDDIKRATDLNTDRDSYFDLSLGKFFMNIGHSIVQEYVQNDLLKQQNRKLYRAKKGGHSTKLRESSIASLKNNLEFSKENNAPYKFEQKKCKFCPFKSESLLVLSHHLETTPHMKNGVYTCNFCSYLSKKPHDILFHMKTLHNTRGKLERPPAYHQCPNCPFEDNGKGKLARHFVSCSKKFKPETNLAPPPEWEPPAKIPKLARSRNPMMSSYHNAFNRSQMASYMKYATNNNMAANMASNMASNMAGNCRPKNRTPVTIAPMPTQMQALPMLKGGVTVRHASEPVLGSNYANGKSSSPKLPHQPSISITPLPRQPQPVPVQTQQNKNTCVICEICDGYIKDLEQLRNHMQWIHKVKIHPKMIHNRRPLNCQKCQFRFFTDQGLERHLLGSHGLVTSSIQEAAKKNEDAGRCPVCGMVYQSKLLNHVGRDHNITLKPAHLSYKCTVCTATFEMYKLFENHVYSAHSIVAKRVMDKGKTHSVTAGQSLLKPMKINDEITIIPQPAPGKSDVKDD